MNSDCIQFIIGKFAFDLFLLAIRCNKSYSIHSKRKKLYKLSSCSTLPKPFVARKATEPAQGFGGAFGTQELRGLD